MQFKYTLPNKNCKHLMLWVWGCLLLKHLIKCAKGNWASNFFPDSVFMTLPYLIPTPC